MPDNLSPIIEKKFRSLKEMTDFLAKNENNITVTSLFYNLLEVHYVLGSLGEIEFVFTRLPNLNKKKGK